MAFKYGPNQPTLEDLISGRREVSKKKLLGVIDALVKHINGDDDIAQKDYDEIMKDELDTSD